MTFLRAMVGELPMGEWELWRTWPGGGEVIDVAAARSGRHCCGAERSVAGRERMLIKARDMFAASVFVLRCARCGQF